MSIASRDSESESPYYQHFPYQKHFRPPTGEMLIMLNPLLEKNASEWEMSKKEMLNSYSREKKLPTGEMLIMVIMLNPMGALIDPHGI